MRWVPVVGAVFASAGCQLLVDFGADVPAASTTDAGVDSSIDAVTPDAGDLDASDAANVEASGAFCSPAYELCDQFDVLDASSPAPWDSVFDPDNGTFARVDDAGSDGGCGRFDTGDSPASDIFLAKQFAGTVTTLECDFRVKIDLAASTGALNLVYVELGPTVVARWSAHSANTFLSSTDDTTNQRPGALGSSWKDVKLRVTALPDEATLAVNGAEWHKLPLPITGPLVSPTVSFGAGPPNPTDPRGYAWFDDVRCSVLR